ncbi:2-C-methyl-D-erythritol 2 [Forsythia ovata]|uniref:2-C-methyl-D-erythritol 2 n=1 Tax=Forsythia ovata TaxID=205694 RepID=A0ABD1T6V0_9LAMI
MAMATSIHYTTLISNKILSKLHHQHKPSGACFTRNSVFLSLKSTVRNSSSLARAATSVVEAETQKPFVTPAKLLPFRVGHGFDLHRLEPGYPFIIDGINIPHDRGCKAHSDVKEDQVHASVSQRSNLTYLKIVLNRFDAQQNFDFDGSTLGHLARLSERQISAKLFTQLIVRNVMSHKRIELCFKVTGHLTQFRLIEYAVVTGLRCGRLPGGSKIGEYTL